MKLFWIENARQDLLSIRRYIAADNPAAAGRWVEQLRERARKALDAPLAGRKVPEFSRDDIRERIEGNYRTRKDLRKMKFWDSFVQVCVLWK